MKETYKNHEIEVTVEQREDKWSPRVTFTPPVVGVRGFRIIGDFKTETAAEVAGFDWARERIDKYSP